MESLTIVKVGGKVLENETSLSQFIEGFSKIEGKKVLVHGGGVLANQLLLKQGIEPRMIEGRRITDLDTLDTVIMVYGGLINKKVVAKLTQNNQLAIGLTGADGLIIESIKRPIEPIDYGYAGDVVNVNIELLVTNLKGGYIPVIAPLSMSKSGQILNTNADTIATELALSLSKEYHVNLIYGFEINGVLADIKEPKSLIKQLDHESYRQLKETKKVHAGMVPKLDNAFKSIQKTKKTTIAHFSKVFEVSMSMTDECTEILKSI